MSQMKAAAVAVLCCSGLFLNSCMYEVPVYGGVSYSNGYGSVSVSAWTDASYDANGFPIYGYYYGRPVYGYTPEGVAIFTFAALTAACFVPHWDPAPWYHGHWHYPHHIHRSHVPHHCPHDHHPSRRPAGGMNAPIHKNPQSVLHGNHGNHSPQHNNRAPQMNAPQHSNMPGVGRREHERKQANNLPMFNPQQHKGNRPGADRNDNRGPHMNLPQQNNHGNRMPQMNRPSAPSAPSMPQMSRPSAPSAPSMPQMSRPSAPSAPSMPQMSRPSASSMSSAHSFGGNSGHSFGGHSGGNHGGHRR